MPRKKKEDKIEFASVKDRKAHLNKILKALNKQNETESLMYASQLEETEKEKIPFNIPLVDELIGGGLKKGLFYTLWGGEGVGKSTTCYYLTASAQKQEQIVVYIDLEHKFDYERAKNFGVNLEELVLMRDIDNAEQAMETIRALAKNKVADVIIVDSIHGMIPKSDKYKSSGADKPLEKDSIATLARNMSKFFKMVSNDVAKNEVAVLLVGQARIGGIGSFYVHEVLSGGRSVSHWSSLILRFRKGQSKDAPKVKIKIGDKSETRKIGFDLVIKLDKTQVTGTKPENTAVHIPFYFESAFNEPKEITNGKKKKEKKS